MSRANGKNVFSCIDIAVVLHLTVLALFMFVIMSNNYQTIYAVDDRIQIAANRENLIGSIDIDDIYKEDLDAEKYEPQPEPDYREGWNKINNNWYYISSSGSMQTGWQKIKGSWYHLGSRGAMNQKSGWNKIGSHWYYQTSNGGMATGWVKDNNDRYYMKDNAIMQTGWQKINGSWYYLANGGAMKTGQVNINGIIYYFNSSGSLKEPVITTEEDVKKVYILHTKIIKADPTLEKGKRVIERKGESGLIEKVYLITYEDWDYVDEELISKKIISEATDEIVRVGTKFEGSIPTPDVDLMNKEFLAIVNTERVKVGVDKLSYRYEPQIGADIRAEDLGYSYGHTRPNGKDWHTVFDYIDDYHDVVASENVARIFTDNIKDKAKNNNISLEKACAEMFFKMYKDSPGHYNSMISSRYTSMTVGVFDNGYDVYNAMIFSW